MTLGQRLVRLATTATVRSPALWRFFRAPLRRTFDRLAPEWDATRVDPLRLTAMSVALEAVERPPARVLDVGTGTGAVARLAARLWPDAEVVGVDSSPAMIEEARRLASTDRERYVLGDASALPFPDASFDLVAQNNMIPFFDELARVAAPGGVVAVAYARGPKTPIWVPLERVRAELGRRGFSHVAQFAAGPGLSLLAKKADRP